MIRLKNIHKTYPGAQPLHVLKGIDLEIKRGELIAIMGASGSGKSTLLNILGILDVYDQGHYMLDNEAVRDLNENQAADMRNRKIGFVFQSFNLIPFKNALENIALPLYYRGMGYRERMKRAKEYLDYVGLGDWAHHLPSELSGGQKQRVAIARALVTQPSVILADEPTGALDSKTTEEVMQLFQEMNRRGMTIIIVTHERAVAEQCSRIVHMRDGMIISE